MRQKYPGKRVQAQPHAVSTAAFVRDSREAAHKAFPQIRGRQILLCVGRIDPVKNQGWLIEQMPAVLKRHPDAMLVLAGACTDKSYGVQLLQRIGKLGLETHVLLTGGLPPGDSRLLGLFQAGAMVLLPSISETFGLVILEAWAAGVAPVSSRTSGARSLIHHGENGFLFDLENPASFHDAVDALLSKKNVAREFGTRGKDYVKAEFDTQVLARRVKHLYEELIEEKRGV
jgi:glycosyltransferase involved in cell wall biosynthesis